jgi:site-specific recombinase XerD
MASQETLRVEEHDGHWRLVGGTATRWTMVNEFLGYLADRRYSPRTVRAYAFDLLGLCRWLSAEGMGIEDVSTAVLLRFLTFCRTAKHPGRPGGNVYSIVDGRNAGYSPATINRRLAAVSALFGFQQMRDPTALNPVPRRREARRVGAGERGGLLGHLAKPRPRSGLRVR